MEKVTKRLAKIPTFLSKLKKKKSPQIPEIITKTLVHLPINCLRIYGVPLLCWIPSQCSLFEVSSHDHTFPIGFCS